ncbi:MAG TPA: hypothetical protein VJM77_02575 [Nitrospiria bacterium]|nr:hypothetical protein [Nitrospiria bacterium]
MSQAIVNSIIFSLAVFFGVTLLAFIARKVLFRLFHRWVQKTETGLDDLSISNPIGLSQARESR